MQTERKPPKGLGFSNDPVIVYSLLFDELYPRSCERPRYDSNEQYMSISKTTIFVQAL